MNPVHEHQVQLTRRHFLRSGVGLAAIASLLRDGSLAQAPSPLPHFAPKAKRVIYLFQSGGPSQMDLFDHKPQLAELRGTELPDSIRKGQRLTGMTATQTSFPIAPSIFKFAQHGQVGRVAQRTAAAHGEGRRRALLHQVDAHRGDQSRPGHHVLPDRLPAGRPAEHRLVAQLRPGQRERGPAGVRRDDLAGQRQYDDQPLYDRLWGSGFLPSKYQGVKFRSGGDPVLYLSNPPGIDRTDAAADARRSRRAEPAASSTRSAIRRSPRASRSTRWRSACRRPCRS